MIYTIGHSNHPIEKFVSLLQAHDVTAVADVRSAPYSRRNPQFNRDALNATLRERSIAYVFLGKELGARSNDQACYVNGRVQYELLAGTPLFQSGIARLIDGSSRKQIALMCAEKDPLNCHRTVLVARELVKSGLEVSHILDAGELETHDDAMKRLIGQLGLPGCDQPGLFGTYEDSVADACTAQANKIAYSAQRPATEAG